MSDSEFLLEFFTEEIPAKMQSQAAQNLERLFKKAFEENRLSYESIECFYSPQRLGCVIKGLPQYQSDFSEERKGPSKKAPEKALAGFLKSAGLTIDDCEWRETGKGEYLFANIFQKGHVTTDILNKIILDIAKNFPWKKSMRWGAHTFRWVRPLHNIMAIFDGKTISGELDLDSVREEEAKITFTNHTWGHRFLSPEKLTISDHADYVKQLKDHKVIITPDERKKEISRQIQKICKDNQLTLIEDEALLNEVTGLVEYPTAYLGKIDNAFMALPPEVMQTSMRENQKYFSLKDTKNDFASAFIVVANHIPKDDGKEIIHGNQKVLAARLSDAAFFYEQDLKTLFPHYREQLKTLTFQDGLGTIYDKTNRLKSLIKQLNNSEEASSIAEHYKNDLVTGMVGEFPELQGIMGSYYAKLGYFSDIESQAIRDQYSPAGPNDICPKATLSIQLGIADRVDTLVGFFGKGIKPTGSKDPYALRRAALALIRLSVENKYTFNLNSLIDTAAQNYNNTKVQLDDIKEDLLEFIYQRFYIYLKDQGHSIDLIECLFSNNRHFILTDISQKLKILEATNTLSSIVSSYKRLDNMLSAELKKSDLELQHVDKELLVETQEKALHDALQQHMHGEDFEANIQALTQLTPFINQFLDDVHINVDDSKIKTNRYSLMQSAFNIYQEFADFSKIN